jgi:hypothetical protein
MLGALARRLAVTLAVALLTGPWPLAATPARPADQRLVSDDTTPTQSHLGSSVAMSRGVADAFALAGEPGACTSGGGGVHHFQYAGGAGWEHHHRSCHIPNGSPQAFPMDIEGAEGYVAAREFDAEDAVVAYAHSGLLGWALQHVPAPEAKAMAFHTDVMALGMPGYSGGRGLIWIFEPDGAGGWVLVGGFEGEQPGDRLGSALAAKPGILVAGAPGYGDNGAVFTYVRAEDWIFWQRLDSPAALPQEDAEFGAAVDISADSWIAVGSPLVDRLIALPGGSPAVDIGAVYLYEVVGLGWELETLLRPPETSAFDRFGTSVALHDAVLVAGSPGEDGPQGDEGAAYVYQRSGGEWQTLPHLRLVDPDAEEHDALGTSVAAGDLGALVGAPFADGNEVFDQGAVLYFRAIAAVFGDGFESGDLSAWSVVTP